MPGAGAAAGGLRGLEAAAGAGPEGRGRDSRGRHAESISVCVAGPALRGGFKEGVPVWIGGVRFPRVGAGAWRQVCGEWGGLF